MRTFFCLYIGLGQAFVGHALQTEDHSTFSNPSARDRPRFRYWLPDASINPSVLKSDIGAAGALGMGGVELVPFYNYGGQIGGPPAGLDWVKYGFGTPAFLKVMEAALEAHDEAGMVMDFAFGPSEGQGVPASSEDEGLQWDLVPFYETVPADGRINTTVAGWGTGNLVAVVSAVVIQSQNLTKSVISPPLPQPTNITHEQLTLDADTLIDITDKVDPLTGLLTTTLPKTKANGTVRTCIFSFWEKRTLKRNLEFTSNDSSSGIWANGSYVVDHFSARGAEVITGFWDEHILSYGKIGGLLRKVGNVGWEDSVELKCNISWSPTILGRFQRKLGYDLRPYLPLIAFGNNNIGLQSDNPGIYDATLSSEDMGQGHLNDYRAVLADGYIEYLQTLSQWLKDTLGLLLSVQPSYNLAMDMLSTIPYVDVPESESLQGSNNIDGYRQFAGPNNLAGNNIISNELGAVFGKAFSLKIPELLHMANRGFAGGVNQYIVHGQPYSGDYPETTWPGHIPFLYHASDMYTTKRPDWNHGLQHAMEYLARVQHVQRQGIHRVDVAIYNKNVTDPFFSTVYDDDDLVQAGWSYNYLSPDNLNLEHAVVENGLLSPERAGYTAMVILGSQNLTSSGVMKIKEYAEEGLPIIVSGGSPGYYPTGNATDRLTFERSLTELLLSPRVHGVDKGKVADKLQELDLKPRVATKTDNIVHTTWREDLAAGLDYLFVFSDLLPSKGELTVRSSRIPYSLDPWKGVQLPLQHYHAVKDVITIPLILAANQTAIYVFAKEPLDDTVVPGNVHMTKAPPSVIGHAATRRGLQLHVASSSSPEDVQLSTGAVRTLNSSAAPSFSLGPWNLTAEMWEAPENLYQASVPAVKRNLTEVTLQDLAPWTSIQDLRKASGLGYYSTSFTWSESPCGKHGAYLSFSPALDAINVRINGRHLPPLDPTHPVADISPYLVQGENEIVTTVPSSMWNYLRGMLDDLESSGREPLVKLLGIPPPSQNGLIGEVEVVPFERILVE